MEVLVLGLIACLLALSLACFSLFVILRWGRRGGQASGAAPPGYPAPAPSARPAPSRANLPYTRARALLTDAERDFFEALRAAAPAGWYVFPQVRLANLVHVSRGTRNWRPHFSRVAAKCVDFVLCEPAALSPRLVVELDDSSHQRPDRQRRDAFVDAALGAAGLPILHVRWQRRYDPSLLAADIHAAVGLNPTPAPAPALPVRWACRSCGAGVGEAAKYCNSCGVALEIAG